ncbi:helix-turn-helix domain-containing protein [Nocardia sp. NPDC059240]|uniref:helix-turn-helix domain-containing protein n=1 Tax=Nocardia sp. NPDC059240 TaxID=3346786 RepID=UPI00369815E9
MTRSRRSRKAHPKSKHDDTVLLTVRQAARVAHVDERTVRRWVNRGVLTRHWFGPGDIRIDRGELVNLGTPITGGSVA